jgi:hypothetical protein
MAPMSDSNSSSVCTDEIAQRVYTSEFEYVLSKSCSIARMIRPPYRSREALMSPGRRKRKKILSREIYDVPVRLLVA